MIGKKVVTLYIDDTSIRLLVAQGDQIKKWATLPLKTDLIRDGIIVDKTKVAAAIRKLFKEQKVRAKKVIVGISGLHCLSQLITLPYLPRALFVEAVQREAERVLPVPLEELYIFWQTVASSGEETLVFVAALPREDTDALIDTVRQAGINPYIMDLAPLTLTRAADKATATVIDVRAMQIDIAIMVGGIPQLLRSVSLPRKDMSLEDKLPTIKDELERTIKFYNTSHPEKPFEPDLPIFASGELAEATEACQSLADQLEFPVLTLSSPFKSPEGFPQSHYMVNIGLALKELSPRKWVSLSIVNLNTLPEAYQPKPITLGRVLLPLGIAAAIGVILFLGMLVRGAAADIANLQGQVDLTDQLLGMRLEKWQSQKEQVEELEKQVIELDESSTAFNSVIDSFSSQQSILVGSLQGAIASHNLPSSADLSIITHSSVEFTLEGVTDSETEVLEYASLLRSTDRFSQVTISSIVSTEDGVSFALTLSARR